MTISIPFRADPDSVGERGRAARVAGIAMVASMPTLASSFAVVKLACIVAFVIAVAWDVRAGRGAIRRHSSLIGFYLSVSLLGATWSLVGLFRPGNYDQAVVDALKLYVGWSAAFVVLFTLVRAGSSLRIVHGGMIAAGIAIPLINFLGLLDQLAGWGLIPGWVREELNLEIGIGNGYLQYSTENIRSMFVVGPYLLAMQFRRDAGEWNPRLTRLALVLSLGLVAISGRRALWLVTVLTPGIVFAVALLSRSTGALRRGGLRFLVGWAVAGALGLGLIFGLPEGVVEQRALVRIREAFSGEDERSVQAPYLLEGFMRSPILGSGFGGHAGYQRSEAPWKYELTYHTILFNMGVVGASLLAALYGMCIWRILRLLGQFQEGSCVPFALLVGVLGLLGGANTNPYFGGFDALFLVGFLPYLSTFHHGFLADTRGTRARSGGDRAGAPAGLPAVPSR